MAQRVIFHVDANSAFLSWSAAYRKLVLQEETDLREIPSVVAGDRESRHSIILAKSTPAKKFGIQTGEPIAHALQKCPGLAGPPASSPVWVFTPQALLMLLAVHPAHPAHPAGTEVCMHKWHSRIQWWEGSSEENGDSELCG